MNCSQLIFGAGERGDSKTGGDFGVAAATEIGGGVATGECGSEITGCGATAGGGGATGAGVTIFACDTGVVADSKGFGDSFSRFNRKISDSSSSSGGKVPQCDSLS
jgi:hypothetical protein